MISNYAHGSCQSNGGGLSRWSVSIFPHFCVWCWWYVANGSHPCKIPHYINTMKIRHVNQGSILYGSGQSSNLSATVWWDGWLIPISNSLMRWLINPLVNGDASKARWIESDGNARSTPVEAYLNPLRDILVGGYSYLCSPL